VALQLKFKGKKPTVQPRRRWISQTLEDIKNRGKSCQETEKEKTVGKWMIAETSCPTTHKNRNNARRRKRKKKEDR
jgi:hypothetical protein